DSAVILNLKRLPNRTGKDLKLNKMSVDEELRIQIVLMMANLEYPSLVRRHFHRENLPNIPSEKTMKTIFNKFSETGSIYDQERSGRPSSATDEKFEEIVEVLSDNPTISVRNIARKVNISKSVVHRTMREMLGFKPYKMHLTQQLYERARIYE
ncbi:unnamed protein product, partial [Didymodactylos carnosus]